MPVFIRPQDANENPVPYKGDLKDLACQGISPNVFLTESAFWNLAGIFDRRFICQPDIHVVEYRPLDYEHQVFSWSDLEEDVMGTSTEPQMLLVFFGLEDRIVRYGFKAVTYTVVGNEWRFNYNVEPSHVLKAGKFHPLDAGDWDPTYRHPYRKHLKSLRKDGVLYQVDDADPTHVALPWAELACMHENTRPADGKYQVAINSIAEHSPGRPTMNEEEGYYHSVAFYLEKLHTIGRPTPMLDDLAQVVVGHYKAADLVNRCPPRCGVYTPVVALAPIYLGFDQLL